MTTPTKVGAESSTLYEELKEFRRSMHDAGDMLLHEATTSVKATAEDTLSATTEVVAAAEDSLAGAGDTLRRVREQLRNRL